jgi:hypothetical protein
VRSTGRREDQGYDSTQRKRDLPEEESEEWPSGEPATVLAKHSGNWVHNDGTSIVLTTDVTTEREGSPDFGSVPLKRLWNRNWFVIWMPSQIFEKSEEGAMS